MVFIDAQPSGGERRTGYAMRDMAKKRYGFQGRNSYQRAISGT